MYKRQQKIQRILGFLQNPANSLESKQSYLSDIHVAMEKPLPIDTQSQYDVVSRKRRHEKINRLGYPKKISSRKERPRDATNLNLGQKLVHECASLDISNACWKYAVCADQLDLLHNVSLENE